MSIGTVLSSILAVVVSLALVIALAWGALWLLRRFQDSSFGKARALNDGRNLRFVRALPLGPRERLVLIEVDGEEMLVGVTAHTITQLKSWPPGSRPFTADEAAPPAPDTAEPRERPRFRLPLADTDQP